MEERNVTCTPVLARFNRPPAVGDQWSCLGLCATQVRPRSGTALPGGVKGQGIPSTGWPAAGPGREKASEKRAPALTGITAFGHSGLPRKPGPSRV